MNENINTAELAYSVRRLDKQEIVKEFDCGDADLNDFILNESPLYRKELLAVSYVAENQEKGIIGYFSLANDRVSLSDFENKTAFNRFRRHRFVNEKRLKSYPAVKICRLGIDLSAKGFRVGSELLYFIKSYFTNKKKRSRSFISRQHVSTFFIRISRLYDYLQHRLHCSFNYTLFCLIVNSRYCFESRTQTVEHKQLSPATVLTYFKRERAEV